MLLEESSQRLPYTNTRYNKSETEWKHSTIPKLIELKQSITSSKSTETPTSYFSSYFSNQASNNKKLQKRDNRSIPSTPRTPCWVYQSDALNSGKKARNCFSSWSPLMTMSRFRFPFIKEPPLKQEEVDLGLSPPREDPWWMNEESTEDYWRNENAHPGGGSREPNSSQERCTSPYSDDISFAVDSLPSMKHDDCIPSDNNTCQNQGELSHDDFMCRQDSCSRDGYLEHNQYDRSQRKNYSSGISARDLKLFTKAIGFKNHIDGTHNDICELLDYLIDARKVYEASTCPWGSKFLQHQIINANWADRSDILQQVMEKLVTICNENYGNYVVQCFFMLSDPEIEEEILLEMKGSLCAVAMNQYGCRVLQKAITTINYELLQIVIDAIAPNAYQLAVHNFGCHVLQRLIERGSGEAVRALLYSTIRGKRKNRLVELAKNSFGCRIIQRMLEMAFHEDSVIIIEAITGSPWDLLSLCVDEFGNYVIQHIVKQFQEKHSETVMDVLDGRLLKMAKNKFCSNVLEVLYKSGGKAVEDRLIKQVDRNFLKECLNDRFANYLVQTMLMEGQQENRVKVRQLLQTIPHLKELKYGKFVIYRLCRLNRTLAKEKRGLDE